MPNITIADKQTSLIYHKYISSLSPVFYADFTRHDGTQFMSDGASGIALTATNAIWTSLGRYFDGSSTSAITQSTFKTPIGAKTIIAWVMPEESSHANDADMIIGETDGSQNSFGNFLQWVKSTNIYQYLLYKNVAGQFHITLNSPTLTPKIFHCVAITWDGTTVNPAYMFVNGNIVASATATGLETTVPTNVTKIGDDYFSGGTPDRNFLGTISLVAIFNRALSPYEVQNIYHLTKSKYQ